MNYIDYLKHEYNKQIDANKKAEKAFKTGTVAQCCSKGWIDRFNEITRNLSSLMHKLEKSLDRELTYTEKFEGFKEVR